MASENAESASETKQEPEWEVAIKAYGPDDEPGESRWEHYHPKAPDKQTARKRAIKEAEKPGIGAIIGRFDSYEVIEVTGPYDSEAST